MIPKTILIGIALVILIAFSVSLIEFFVPLSAKAELNNIGRQALLKLEANNKLTTSDIDSLTNKLTGKGFSDITISATQNAKQGEELTLDIEAHYMYSKLSVIFSRLSIDQLMRYTETTIARKVVN